MKKLLVPTDFSDCAGFAAETALELAKKHGSKIHFYHFMSIPIDWIHLEQGQELLYPDVSRNVKKVKEQLNELVRMAEKEGVEATSYVDFDTNADGVNRYVREQEISMIIMGSHGSHGVKEFFLGSNAQKVVRNAQIPVLTIKKRMTTVEVPTIMFVSDFADEMIKPFENVVRFAEMLGAKIHLVFINTPSDFHRSWEIRIRMESFVALSGGLLEKSEIVDAWYFEEGLEKYCGENCQGLLAIATHHKKGLSRAFLGSLTEKVVNHVTVPVISFPVVE